MSRPRVLILTRYYLPGINGGGPVVSVSNMVSALSSSYDFFIATPDTDVGETEPFPAVVTDEWQQVGAAKVYYARSSGTSLRRLAALIRKANPDVVYLNSFFSYRWTILPLLLSRSGVFQVPIIVAPRGEFAPGALSRKGWKKRPYVFLSRLTGLYRDVLWQATNAQEAEDIRAAFGPASRIHIAHNLPRPVDEAIVEARPEKRAGCLRLVYLSRLHPSKNLRGALEALMRVQEKIRFDIFGPVEDRRYWEACRKLIENLPANVTVEYGGRIQSTDVPRVMAKYDAFILPTLSENFGHVIFESLAAGTPVIVSDRTPWRELAKRHAGFDLDLSNLPAFTEKIDFFAKLGPEEFDVWSTGANNAARALGENANILAESESLFHRAIEEGGR